MTQYKPTGEAKRVSRAVGSGAKEDRNEHDFYPTPYSLTTAILQYENFDGPVLEPAYGDGAIAKILREQGHEVCGIDIRQTEPNGAYFLCTSFLSWGGEDAFDAPLDLDVIFTNPPFSLWSEFVIKSFEIAKKKIIILGKLDYLHGNDRYEVLMNSKPWGLSKVVTFARRSNFTANPAVDDLSGMFSYAWFVFDKGFLGPTQLIIHDNRPAHSKAKIASRQSQLRAGERMIDFPEVEQLEFEL